MTESTQEPEKWAMGIIGETPSIDHVHLEWLRKTAREMADDWERIYARTSGDKSRTQEGGHEAETAWAEFLTNWLPPTYEVATRKYIIGEVDTGIPPFETDIIIYRPSYPKALRAKTQVLAAGVAAAFSVKTTLRAEGIAEAVDSCAKIQRTLSGREATMRRELVRPFPYGLLAHSHMWKKPGSKPADNISSELFRRDHQLSRHPKESLELVCVPDVGTWCKQTSYSHGMHFPPDYFADMEPELRDATIAEIGKARLSTVHVGSQREDPALAIAVFLTALYSYLAMQDPGLDELARSFSKMGGFNEGSGLKREWVVESVLTAGLLSATTHTGWPLENGENSHHFGSTFGF